MEPTTCSNLPGPQPAPRQSTTGAATLQVPPPDDDAHLDNVLMAEVARVNVLLGRYVVRFLDSDALRAEPIGTADERALADQVTNLAEEMRARAERRENVLAVE